MGALASGTAAAVGSGAFSAVSAERTVSVEVADEDTDALLGLEPLDTDRVVDTGEGIEIDLTGEAGDDDGVEPKGLNPNASTDFTDLFNVVNQSTNDVLFGTFGGMDIRDQNDAIDGWFTYSTDGELTEDGEQNEDVDNGVGTGSPELEEVDGGSGYVIPEGATIDEDNNVRYLEPGESTPVSFTIQTTNEDLEDFDEELTIAAVGVGTARDQR